VAPAISAIIRRMCAEAVEKARADGRKTVMDRDFQ
jgi:histone H3/H4